MLLFDIHAIVRSREMVWRISLGALYLVLLVIYQTVSGVTSGSYVAC